MTRKTLALFVAVVATAGCQSKHDAIDEPVTPNVVVSPPPVQAGIDRRPIRQTIVIGRGEGTYAPSPAPPAVAPPVAAGPTIVIQNTAVSYGGGYGYGGYGGSSRASPSVARPASGPPRVGGDWPRAPSYGPPMIPHPNARWP